jgi:23S rRNA (adenine2030-N6)-methyltransferase
VKYRHSYHAGNFADVHKHVTLLALLAALQRKDKGLLYLDTHAGRGLYDLAGPEAHQSAEARGGIVALALALPQAAPLRDYLRGVATARERSGNNQCYPGSALLVAQSLRSQDRAVCYELQPPEERALARALGPYPRARALCGDGLAAIEAQLPPPERRALVLIDPPYEDTAAELKAGLDALQRILGRLANALTALWYPIKDERTLAPWLALAEKTIAAPVLLCELWLHPRDSRVALNGSGLMIVNPPYQFDQAAREWLPELGSALGAAAHGGTTLRWIVHESA